MEVSVIKIGNSKGIRLSKSVLEKYQIRDSVEMVFEEDCILLKPVTAPRKNWTEAFREMHENGDDALMLPDVFEDENSDI